MVSVKSIWCLLRLTSFVYPMAWVFLETAATMWGFEGACGPSTVRKSFEVRRYCAATRVTSTDPYPVP